VKEDKNTQVIKDILYERSTREMLLNTPQQSRMLPFYKKIAAVAAVGILAFLIYQLNGPSADITSQRMAMAQEMYELPQFNKSRGVSTSVIDNNLSTYYNQNWNTLIPILAENHENEKDAFALVNIYYSNGDLSKAQSLIKKYDWSDEYNLEQVAWLDFLISFRKGESVKALVKKADILSIDYKEKAYTLIAEL